MRLAAGAGANSSGPSVLNLARRARKPLLRAPESLAIPAGVRPEPRSHVLHAVTSETTVTPLIYVASLYLVIQINVLSSCRRF